jgi:cellulose synthase operon protein C
LLEKNWKCFSPLALAQACLKVTQDGRGPKNIVDRILSILRQSRGHFQDHTAIALTLGNLYTGMGKYAEAEESFRGVLEKSPRDAVAMNNLAAVLAAERKDLDEALELIEKAMKISGPLAQMLDTRACVHIARSDGEKALADLADALADAKTPERLFHQAQAYELAGQKRLAAKSMKEAIAKGLSEKTLSAVEIPIYERLKKAADELPPSKEDDGPLYIEGYAAIFHSFPRGACERIGTKAPG